MAPVIVFSDIHDKLSHLDWLMDTIARVQPRALIGCGDYSTPETLERLADLGLPLHFCLGNTDETARDSFFQAASARPWVSFAGRLGRADFQSRRVMFTHYPELALQAASDEKPDAVFFGHTHRRHEEIIDGVLLANPGDIQNRHGTGPSCLAWDPDENRVEFLVKEKG